MRPAHSSVSKYIQTPGATRVGSGACCLDPSIRGVMAMAGTNKTDPPDDLIDITQLMRVLEDEPDSADED